MDDADLVRVATIYSRSELICFVSVLEAYGIHVFTFGAGHGSVDPVVIALGGYQICVLPQEYQSAIELIDETELGLAEYKPSLARYIRLWVVFVVSIGMVGAGIPMPITGRSDYVRSNRASII
jgi:hypothetical protein